MLWGKHAQKFEKCVGEFHEVMTWLHPSPLAQGGKPDAKKFINCDHFTRANRMLERPIDWNVREIASDPDDSSSDEKSDGPDTSRATGLETPREYLDGYDPAWFESDGTRHVVFTDGSCNPNRKCKEAVGGYGAVFVDGQFTNTLLMGNLSTKKEFASNIRAEGMAIRDAIELILTSRGLIDAIILTDCKHWVNMLLKYMPGWSEAKFRTMANFDLNSDLWNLWSLAMRRGKITIVHIRAHNRSGWMDEPAGTYKRYCAEQNDYIDKIATHARKTMGDGERRRRAVDYEELWMYFFVR